MFGTSKTTGRMNRIASYCLFELIAYGCMNAVMPFSKSSTIRWCQRCSNSFYWSHGIKKGGVLSLCISNV